MFDFSKEKIDGGNVSVFNNGNAGVVKGVKLSVEKKGKDFPEEEGKNQPDYRILYTDENGSVNTGFYHLVEADHKSEYTTYLEAVKKQWKKVASIAKAVGADPNLEFKDATDMLDSIMLLIKNNCDGKTFNVFANYGHVNNPRKYIQVRSWTPFIEPSTEDGLSKMNIDQLERLVPDAPKAGESVSSDGWS